MLQLLHELPAGQSASAEDASTVEEFIDGVAAQLSERKLAVDVDAPPLYAFELLAEMVAASAAPAFEFPEAEVAGYRQRAGSAEKELRAIMTRRKRNTPVKARYY